MSFNIKSSLRTHRYGFISQSFVCISLKNVGAHVSPQSSSSSTEQSRLVCNFYKQWDAAPCLLVQTLKLTSSVSCRDNRDILDDDRVDYIFHPEHAGL